jgi:putative transposase
VEAQPFFERLFREYGLPGAIRTDNGAPFATPAFCGLSKLSVWWIKLGIRHQRTEPGRPEQNGRHERMHRTLKAEATRPPARNQAAQQARFDRFCRKYNHERPHEALGQRTPASLYHSSPRRMPAKLAERAYPGHCLVRRVSDAGTFRFKSRRLFLSDTWLQQRIALEETIDGMWSLYFYDVLLARLDERDFKLRG